MKKLNTLYKEKCSLEKENYYSNMVEDLKSSCQGQWYSKVKRMSGLEKDKLSDIIVEEISDHSYQDQAEMIADH